MIVKVIKCHEMLTNTYVNGKLGAQRLWKEMEADVVTPAGCIMRVKGDEKEILARFGN